MSGLILDITPGGKVTTMHNLLADEKTVLAVSQDVTDVMERCAVLRAAEETRGMRKASTFRQIAEIPTALAEILAAQGMDIINDEEALRKFLNDPVFAAFRTSRGRV